MATKTYNTNNTEGGGLYWPYNLTDNFDYLQMDISNFVPRASRTASAQVGTQQTPTPTAVGSDFNLVDLPLYGDYTNLEFTPTTTTLSKSNSILLPIPEDISYKDNPQWSDQAVGVMGRFGPQVAKGLMDGADSGQITDSIQQMAKAGSVGKLLEMVKKLQADPNAITQNINGKIANPYVEQVFGGVGMRQFDFSWKLVPRNKSEQASIHNIIKTLRTAVLPNKSDTFGESRNENVDASAATSTERWLTVPNVFQLSWRHKGSLIESMPKFKLCVCKDIQVQYTPDNVWASHMYAKNQPYPVAYNLTMSFGETEIITGDLVQQGY